MNAQFKHKTMAQFYFVNSILIVNDRIIKQLLPTRSEWLLFFYAEKTFYTRLNEDKLPKVVRENANFHHQQRFFVV